MFAHYFKKGKSHVLIISETNQPIGKSYIFPGKNEMKKFCKEQGLKPWNF